MMHRLIAGWIGGLLVAVLGGIVVALAIADAAEATVAGALIIPMVWILVALVSFTASSGRAAWARVGAIGMVLLLVGIMAW